MCSNEASVGAISIPPRGYNDNNVESEFEGANVERRVKY